MLDMILELKECLGMVLFTGLLTGLFFAKSKNSEEYKPIIDELKEKIDHTDKEILAIEENCDKITQNIQNEKSVIQEADEQIAKFESKISMQEEEFLAAKSSFDKVKEKYTALDAILKAQINKVNELKSKIGSFTPEALLEKETTQNRKLKQLQNQLKKENETLKEIALRHKNLKAHRDELQGILEPLENSFTQIKELLHNAKNKEETLEENLQNKISSLKNEYNGWLEKIKKYKTELLKLKES